MAVSALRPDVLSGVTVLLAGGETAAIAGHLKALGARTATLEPAGLRDEEAVGAAVDAAPLPDVLVVDGAGLFAAAGAGHDGLRGCVDETWNAVRAVADRRWIDRAQAGAGHRGKVVLLAPAPGAGLHAGPARAALENVARTLSTEWARYAITTVAVLPGDDTDPHEVHELVAFVASPAGDYLTGCAFTLGQIAGSLRSSSR